MERIWQNSLVGIMAALAATLLEPRESVAVDVTELTVAEIEAGLAANTFTSVSLTQSYLDESAFTSRPTTPSSRSIPTRWRPPPRSISNTKRPVPARRCMACRSW